MAEYKPPPRIEVINEAPAPRNPDTQKQHRKEAFWQIFFPVIFATLFIIAVTVVLVYFSGNAGASVAADYAILLLLTPLIFVGLILFVIVVGLMWVMNKGLTSVSSPAYIAQQYIKQATGIADDATDRLAEALIRAKSTMAGVVKGLRREGIVNEEELQVPPELDPRSQGKQ